jgi:hypothetical protein
LSAPLSKVRRGVDALSRRVAESARPGLELAEYALRVRVSCLLEGQIDALSQIPEQFRFGGAIDLMLLA